MCRPLGKSIAFELLLASLDSLITFLIDLLSEAKFILPGFPDGLADGELSSV